MGNTDGANQTTNIDDMATTAVKVGTGELLSKSSYEAMTAPNLLGFGHKQDNCAPSCFTQVNGYNYGLGVVRSGSWLLQNHSLTATARRRRTFPPRRSPSRGRDLRSGSVRLAGNYQNSSDKVFRSIGTYLAPDDAPSAGKALITIMEVVEAVGPTAPFGNQQPQTKVRRRLMRMLEYAMK